MSDESINMRLLNLDAHTTCTPIIDFYESPVTVSIRTADPFVDYEGDTKLSEANGFTWKEMWRVAATFQVSF